MMKKWFLILSCVISVVAFSQDVDVLHYSYYIHVNDNNDSIRGNALIMLVQKSESQKVSFDLAGINKEGKGMKVVLVQISNYKLHFIQDAEKVTIDVPKIKKGDTARIVIVYKGIPSDGLIISTNRYGDKTFFSDNWPNRAHYWIPCNDRPDDKASFEFIVTAPSQYKVISNGVKTEEKEFGDGRTRTHWKEDTPLPTKVMVIGVAKFAVKTYSDSPPNIPVSAWIYQQDSAKGFHDYSPAPEILKFFSDYIAPYPYEKLANVQSKTIFGGMENASAIFYFEGSVTGKGGVEDLLAHEIAHQWFGDMASEKSFAHLWLSEGFATYFTDVFWQYKYGDLAFKKRLQKERDEVIEFVKTNNHPVVDSLSPYMDLLNANSYQKGAWVLHMLRHEVGDSVFKKVIQTYYQQFKGSNADTRDFEAVAEKVSGKNLKSFFDQWLYQPGIPKLDYYWKYDKGHIVLSTGFNHSEITFIFDVEVLFVFQNGRAEKHVLPMDSHGHINWNFESQEKPVKIILDPDIKLLFQGNLIEIK